MISALRCTLYVRRRESGEVGLSRQYRRRESGRSGAKHFSIGERILEATGDGSVDLYLVNLPLTNNFKHLQDSGGFLGPCKSTIAKESMYSPMYHAVGVQSDRRNCPNLVVRSFIASGSGRSTSALGDRGAH